MEKWVVRISEVQRMKNLIAFDRGCYERHLQIWARWNEYCVKEEFRDLK